MKKSKISAGKPRRPQQMTKEELIATLLKKKQCNAKALSIVEGMLDGEVNPQWLLDSLQFIAQSHYQDAVEERAILKICGYPLCKNPLVNVPKQQFRISTQNNKVYDISERKNFCSNACYKSSTFLKDQIMTSPLWLRDIEKVPVYKLLEGNSSRSGAGDEIDLGPTRVTVQEASVGQAKSEEQEEKFQSEDDCKNQLKDDTSMEHVLSGDSAFLSNNGHDIATPDEREPSVSLEDNKLGSIPNESVPKSKEPQSTQEETQLPERSLSKDSNSGSGCSKEATVDVDDGKQKFVPRKNVCDSRSSASREAVACGGEEKAVPEDAKNIAARSDARGAVERVESAGESSNKSAVDRGKNQVKEVKDDERKAVARKAKRPSRDRHASVAMPPVAMPCVSQLVEDRLVEWFTVDSLCFLYGEQKTREMLRQLGGDLQQNFNPLDSATWDPEKHDRFVNICKRLNLLDLEDRTYDEKVINEDKNVVKKPLPDFEKLKEEAERMNLRVQAFFKGQLEVEPRTVTFSEDTKEESTEESVDRELPVIPLVHQHEQRALRRRLVLDSLNRVLPDLLRTIGVHSTQVNSALRGLVGTFALTASNITFNPRHWTLVAIAIIKLLSVRESRLHLALTSEASQKYLTLIQMSYNLGPTYLDLLMDRLISSAIVPPKPADTS